jgi:hypothetical protein
MSTRPACSLGGAFVSLRAYGRRIERLGHDDDPLRQPREGARVRMKTRWLYYIASALLAFFGIGHQLGFRHVDEPFRRAVFAILVTLCLLLAARHPTRTSAAARSTR